MKDLGKLMKQAQEMQSKMTEMQQQIADLEVEGESGAGMLKVVMSGKGDLKKLKIDPSLIDPSDPDMLEDLIIAAHNDALKKTEAKKQELASELTGGLPLPPGFKLPI